LEIDKETTVAKVSQDFDSIASNENFILKSPVSPSLTYPHTSSLNQLSRIALVGSKNLRLPRFSKD
jgi:hypothetical protein